MNKTVTVSAIPSSSPSSWSAWEVTHSKGEWFWFEYLNVSWWFWFYESVWFPFASFLVIFYLVGILFLKWWMVRRKSFVRLKGLMVSLLVGNSLFSIACAYRVLPRAIDILYQTNGVYRLLCVR